MPLIPGSVSVTAGIATGAGLSKEIYDALRSAQSISAIPLNQTPLAELAKYSNTIAQAVIAHIVTNGLISVNVTGTVAAGIPVATTGSAAAQAGTTTATGAVTATGTGTIS